WSEDNAGNVESATTAKVKIDMTAPTITHAQDPAKNGSGWNNTNVTVSFTCSDADAGIKSCTTPPTVVAEGQGHVVGGTATDNAGNPQTDPAKVRIDKTPPTITASRAPAANANGWNNSNVTVSFTCGDTLSGIDVCPAPQTLSEGKDQSVSDTATDAAGNSASTSVGAINVDKTAPTLSGAPTASANANGWYKGDVTIHWTAADALAGVDPSAVPTDSVINGDGGNLGASASVSDLAGNSGSGSVTGIKIDRTAPETSNNAQSGWNKGPVTVN